MLQSELLTTFIDTRLCLEIESRLRNIALPGDRKLMSFCIGLVHLHLLCFAPLLTVWPVHVCVDIYTHISIDSALLTAA